MSSGALILSVSGIAMISMVLLYLIESLPHRPHGLDSPHGQRPPIVPSTGDGGPLNYDG